MHDIFRHYQDKCRKLHCVGFAAVFQGHCVPFANIASGAALGISVTFIPTSSTPVNLTNLQVSQKNVGTIERLFSEKLQKVDCLFYIITIYSFLGRSSNTDVYFTAVFRTVISEKCTFEYLLQHLRKAIASKWRQELVLGDYVFPTISSINFYAYNNRIPSYSYDQNVNSRIIFYKEPSMHPKSQAISVTFYAEMFLCPHFMLNVSEYNAYLERVFEEFDSIQHESLTVTTGLKDEFYLLPEKKIAVCVDTYFSFTNNANKTFGAVRFLQIIALSICFFLLQDYLRRSYSLIDLHGIELL